MYLLLKQVDINGALEDDIEFKWFIFLFEND